jgi:hypothetical protein
LAAVRCAFVRNLRFAFDAPRCQSRGDGGAVIFKTSASCSAKVRAQVGPSQHARQIEDADARQRPVAVRQLFRRTVADL